MEKSILKRVVSLALAVVMVFSVLVVVDPKEVKAADKTLAGEGTVAVDITEEDIKAGASYIAFTPAKTGYVTFTMSTVAPTAGYLTLCNAAKAPISSTDWFRTDQAEAPYYQVSYGVKAGTPYALKVETGKATNVKAEFVKQNKSKKNSKKKAVTIKAGKVKKGVMIAGEKKADWYKINLTKSKKVKLIFKTKTHGTEKNSGIKFSFYKGNGKLFTSDASDCISRYYFGEGSVTYFMRRAGSSKKLGIPAGTYYVKVERANSNSSGYYELKWK